MRLVILLDNSAGVAQSLGQRELRSLACSIAEIANSSEIDHLISVATPHLLVLPVPDSRQVLAIALAIRENHSGIPLLLAVSCGSEELAVAAFRAGITDYFRLPGEESELLHALQLLFDRTETLEQATPPADCSFIGDSPPMHTVKLNVARIAGSNSNVLITGETGTGKELIASAIHEMSSRRGQPFVCVNSAAIPDALFESEWFGYERGAFTGALIRTAGWMESSHRGTMFLDEIGDMSLFAQAKLLRVIESKEFHRLGGKKSVRVDVRFIAATNRNLEEMAGNGKFRQDLYYRLNIARVHLPPLRERREDIPPLLRHYMRELSLQNQNRITEMTDEVRNCLMEYDWPGNIRELKNVLESIFVNAPQGKIRLADLPEQFRNRLEKSASPGNDERQQLITALTRTQWNKSKAAEALRWSRMTLYRKMHKYRIYTPRSA
jgi:DNA-binding NtrC family response regulator